MPKVRARISAVKSDRSGIIILQLLINHPTKEYIASLIIDNTERNREINYKAGQNIHVYIDPKNPHHIIIPETNTEEKPRRKINCGEWLGRLFIIYAAVMIIVFWVIPKLTPLFNQSGRDFKAIEFIHVYDIPGNVWEVRTKSDKKIFITIYNPVTSEIIKSIKDTKEKELDSTTNFFICQQILSRQNQKVFIMGAGPTPVIDVYNAYPFEKLSDIHTFEESNIFLNKGISEIHNVRFDNEFFKDDVFEIITNDGNKCYYNISKNEYYYSGGELYASLDKNINDLLSRQMCVFALSIVPDANEKHQLYMIKATDVKGIPELKSLGGTDRLNVDYLNNNKDFYNKYCDLISLCSNKFFLEGKIIYYDAYLVIIQHVTATNKDAEALISGINNKGETLFTLKQSDYPGTEKMKKDNYRPRDYQKLKIVRANNKIVFMFGKYGGLCVYLVNGAILWKLEL